ncbi:hypothetical protein V6N11_035900 [Hibiscus sabdariffa]|uniref:Uncharacterized protein n=1 Tax=Hibiscus sabdariffa TaxID=183260 RepID=A0ABR2R8T9_9ROSI
MADVKYYVLRTSFQTVQYNPPSLQEDCMLSSLQKELEEDFNVVFNDKCIGVGMSVGEMDILWVDALNGAFPSGEIECRVGRNEGCLSYD